MHKVCQGGASAKGRDRHSVVTASGYAWGGMHNLPHCPISGSQSYIYSLSESIFT